MERGSSSDQLVVQCRRVKDLMHKPLEVGANWFVLDLKWFKLWKSFVGYDSWDRSSVGNEASNPGPIDNSSLIADGSKSALKPHMLENLDFILIPEEAWDSLVEWYQLADGQEPLRRQVIQQGYSSICKVEVYLIDLKLCYYNDIDHPVLKYFSHVDTLQKVVSEMRQLFQVSEDTEVRVLSQYLSNMYEPLSNLSATISDCGLSFGQTLVLEARNTDGSWPCQSRLTITSPSVPYSTTATAASSGSSNKLTASNSSTSNASGSGSNRQLSNSYSSSTSNKGLRDSTCPGLCGLANLGNTCFMNSALQCMSNVPCLTEYMLSGRWKDELNPNNPLGMRGEIASTYAALIETMWSGKQTCAVPRSFKVAVGQFKPEFSGYQQQDSQELMAFLLDGLHEDLNRIRKKPYVEVKEANDRPDEIVAAETWRDYRLRNDSVIVDTFHGLLKSTLVCPDCKKVSVKFDPFGYLSLPLPNKKERHFIVFFVSLRPALRPRQYKLTVPKSGCIEDLCRALSVHTKVSPDQMVVVDLYNHRFHKLFTRSESLMQITERDDIYIYEVPVSSADDPETIILPVYMREQSGRQSYYSSGSTQLFGFPLLVPVPRKNCNYSTLYDRTIQHMIRFIKNTDKNHHANSSSSSSSSNSDGMVQDSGTSADVGQSATIATMGSEAVSPTQRLFEFHFINSYGYTEIDKMPDDGSPLTFNGQYYLAADWTTKNKVDYYNEQEAVAFDADPSVESVSHAKKQSISLYECLELFTTQERLGEHDLWYCPVCKKHQQATKKFDLWDLPAVLVIHLKRFSYSRYNRDKLDSLVDFPTCSLDLKPFVIRPSNRTSEDYDLIAVSNHYGGLGGGHYTAYAKNATRNQWFDFDDSSVAPISEEDVVTKAAYVLVYQRRSAVATNSH